MMVAQLTAYCYMNMMASLSKLSHKHLISILIYLTLKFKNCKEPDKLYYEMMERFCLQLDHYQQKNSSGKEVYIMYPPKYFSSTKGGYAYTERLRQPYQETNASKRVLKEKAKKAGNEALRIMQKEYKNQTSFWLLLKENMDDFVKDLGGTRQDWKDYYEYKFKNIDKT